GSLGTGAEPDLARYESVQLFGNLFSRDAERELVRAARTFGLGLMVWSPLGRGFLSGKYRKGQPPPPGTRLEAWKDSWAMTATDQGWRTLDAVETVAQRRETTPSAVALAWLLAKPEVSTVIVGARTIQQLLENLKALGGRLTPEDLKQLDEVSKPAWGYPYNFSGSGEPG